MSYVALGLFILACGWNLYRDYTPTRTRAIRIEGHPQYFGAALAAGYVLIMAVCLNHALSRYPSYEMGIHRIVQVWPHEAESTEHSSPIAIERYNVVNASREGVSMPDGSVRPDDIPLKTAASKANSENFVDAIAVALWSALLAFALPFLLNLPYMANRRLRHLISYDSLEGVERILVDAANSGVTVAITLTSRKFYVGIPLETDQDGTSETRWIKLNPLASGYRSDDGTLEFTTAYKAVSEEMLSDNGGIDPHPFLVTVPTAQIISIQNFDLDLYTRRFSKEASEVDRPEADQGGIPSDADTTSLGPPNSVQPSEGPVTTMVDSVPASSAHHARLAQGTGQDQLQRQARMDSLLCFLELVFGLAISITLVGLAFSHELVIVAVLAALSAWVVLAFSPTGRLRSSRGG